LTEEQQKALDKNIREGYANQDSLLEAKKERPVERPKPRKFSGGTNMKALLNADQQRMTVAEKQEYLKGKYKAKHDIGAFVSLKKGKRNSKNKGEKSKIPPVSLRKICAPQIRFDLKKFSPTETTKTEWQLKILKKVIQDSVILRGNNHKTENRLIAVMEAVQLKSGQILSKQGEMDEKDDRYFVVEQGRIEFQVDGITVDAAEAGTAFGQDRLLYRHANTATIKASEDTKLLQLDQKTFRGIMQQEEKKQQESKPKEKPKPKPTPVKKTKKTKKSRTIAGEWDLSGSPIFQEQQAMRDGIRKHASAKDDLEFIRLLGEGQFGEVWLVAAQLPEFEEKQQYALKMQDTGADELREDPTDAIWKEITALKVVKHPFIVNLVHVYETEDSIDMLLGLIRGNELWDEVHREDEPEVWVSGFSEARARFYSCVMVDTLAFLHKNEFCFRDFKPENVMIDDDGYPILVDFGFAKYVAEGDKTFTFCGTPNYVAPEIIKMAGHDRSADYWALGVVIYEMVCGENPFFYEGMEQFALYQAISDEMPYDMEGDYSPQVIDLCHQLLEKDPSKRLGSSHPHDILEHKWFRGTPDLAEYRAKKVEPPPLLGGPPISFEESESDDSDEEMNKRNSMPEQELPDMMDPLKRHFSSQDAELMDPEEVDLFPPEDKPKPKIKLVPFKNSNKGGLKGYYAKEKTKEQKLSSKERRAMLSGTLEEIHEGTNSE
jgi:serine/threonine protein kinase